jgi:hypothetical protein
MNHSLHTTEKTKYLYKYLAKEVDVEEENLDNVFQTTHHSDKIFLSKNNKSNFTFIVKLFGESYSFDVFC